MKARIFILGLCVLGLTALVSCTEKELGEETVIDGDGLEICFSASLDGGVTRATEITGFDSDGADDTYPTFNVIGFMYSGDWDSGKSKAELYIDNVPVVKDGSSWTFETKYYWPGLYDRMTFFGYAPVAVADYIEVDETNIPTLTYSDPAVTATGLDLSMQYDLLIAKTADAQKGSNSSVPMNFAHALTAVQFKCGDMPAGTIPQIELSGIRYSGVYDLDAQTWTLGDETVTYDLTGENGLWSSEEDPTPGTDILGGSSTLMMVPQELTGATLSFEFYPYNYLETMELEVELPDSWGAGEEVAYNLSIHVPTPTSVDLSKLVRNLSNEAFTYLDGVLTVHVPDFTIYGGTSSEPYTGEIKIDSDVTTLNLDGVYIDWDESKDVTSKSAAFTVSNDLTLTLTNENTILMKLSDANDHDCILVNGGTLTIEEGDGGGSLTLAQDSSTSLNRGGALMLDNSANLVINSGTITATSSYRCPGIGAGYAATGGAITINGGTVVATGGGQAVGIGAGYTGTCGNVTINGGNVTASTGTTNGGGIGAGNGATCGDIVICGGTVSASATAGTYCTAIGSNYVDLGGSKCGDIYITQDVTSVSVKGSYDAAYTIGYGAESDTSCGTVYLGGSSATDQTATSWTPGTKLTVTDSQTDSGRILGWTFSNDTWTKDN